MDNRRRRGQGKPETFTFLGFAHSCDRTRKGKFIVLRQLNKKRMRRKLKDLKQKLCSRMHEPISQQGLYIRPVLQGHLQHYGEPRNGPALCAFIRSLIWYWYRTLRRRSQKNRLTWQRMKELWFRCTLNSAFSL